jgi:hypothetical protein
MPCPNANKGPESADKFGMEKQMVYWKPVRSRNRFGETFLNPYFPQLINRAYGGKLLFEIVSMDCKIPISFENAINLVEIEFCRAADSGQIGSEPVQCHWYYRNFVQWLSDQGYSIELTGDEFETALICSLVA